MGITCEITERTPNSPDHAKQPGPGTRLRLGRLAHLAHLASLVYHAASAAHTRPEPAPPRRRPARVADPSPPQAPVSTAVCPNRRPPRLKHPMPISTEVDCTLSTHPTIEGESKETTMHLRSAPLRSTHTQLRTGITARAGNWLVARNEANS